MTSSIQDRIRIHKPQDQSSPIKFYADVPSVSRPGKTHKVVFIRKPGMKRWTCSCEDQVIIKTAARKHCRHIKMVRHQIGQ